MLIEGILIFGPEQCGQAKVEVKPDSKLDGRATFHLPGSLECRRGEQRLRHFVLLHAFYRRGSAGPWSFSRHCGSTLSGSRSTVAGGAAGTKILQFNGDTTTSEQGRLLSAGLAC